jgi:hypothetical protein
VIASGFTSNGPRLTSLLFIARNSKNARSAPITVALIPLRGAVAWLDPLLFVRADGLSNVLGEGLINGRVCIGRGWILQIEQRVAPWYSIRWGCRFFDGMT